MKLEATDTLAHDRERVWTTYRDDLIELVSFLPNVDRIEMLERAEPAPGIVTFRNRWHARGDIPTIAQRVIKPEMLRWDEEVTWDQNTWTNHWKVIPAFFTEQVDVAGSTFYTEPADGRTTIRIDGLIRVDAKGIRGVPRLLAGKVGAAVEKLLGTLILPNMKRLNSSLGTYLDNK